jgi:hypothetical protein
MHGLIHIFDIYSAKSKNPKRSTDKIFRAFWEKCGKRVVSI